MSSWKSRDSLGKLSEHGVFELVFLRLGFAKPALFSSTFPAEA